MKKFASLFLAWCLIGISVPSREALGCASCGSGSGDPLILYPNESYKLYLASRYAYSPTHMRVDGIATDNHLARSKAFLDLGLGVRITPRWFFSLYTGTQTNIGTSQSQTDLQEPLLKTRYTLLKQDYLQPYKPQVQLLAGFKSNLSRDKFSSRDLEMIDVFDSGFAELHIGYDLWNGLNAMVAGVSQTLVVSLPEEIDGIKMQPGLALGSVATVGFFYHGANKLLFGYFLNLKDKRKEDGQEISLSSARTHSLFLTADYAINLKTSVRATVSWGGIGKSYNTARSTSVTASLNKTLL